MLDCDYECWFLKEDGRWCQDVTLGNMGIHEKELLDYGPLRRVTIGEVLD